jgi:hypothetical protein
MITMTNGVSPRPTRLDLSFQSLVGQGSQQAFTADKTIRLTRRCSGWHRRVESNRDSQSPSAARYFSLGRKGLMAGW